MRVLVTGGAGYIGAHTVHLLRERGDEVVVVDDLSTGDAARIPGVPVQTVALAGDGAQAALIRALDGVDAVIHFAARKQVGESTQRPAHYYRENVGGLADLLIAMEAAGVARLVFSSSAAVYGAADGALDEQSPTVPISPYGATKLVGEQLLASVTQAWPLSAASLRYFNVGGALLPRLGDTAVLNLVPLTFQAIDAGRRPLVFGDDYPTPDGTCIRDYVHVADVASAHLAVLDALGQPGHEVFNVGTGSGTSVLAMVHRLLAVAGSDLTPQVVARRAGDPASSVALVDRIAAATGWRAERTLDELVASAMGRLAGGQPLLNRRPGWRQRSGVGGSDQPAGRGFCARSARRQLSS